MEPTLATITDHELNSMVESSWDRAYELWYGGDEEEDDDNEEDELVCTDRR